MQNTTASDMTVSFPRAQRLLERAVEDSELCVWCFARTRRYFPDDDRREAQELRWGATKQTLRAKGHTIREDGTLAVNTATSDPDPSTYQDVVPEAWIDGEFHPPRPQSVCSCGVVDYCDDDHRSLSELHTCVDNLAEWFERMDLSMYDAEFDTQAAHDIVTRLRQYRNTSGKDKLVLSEAMRQGVRRC